VDRKRRRSDRIERSDISTILIEENRKTEKQKRQKSIGRDSIQWKEMSLGKKGKVQPYLPPFSVLSHSVPQSKAYTFPLNPLSADIPNLPPL